MIENKPMSTKKTAHFGLLIALAVVLGYVESLVPVYLGAPGVKLGLANLVTMISLYSMGVKETVIINGVRILFTGFTFGPPSIILFGAAGSFLSLVVMYVCKRYRLLGMVGISILGGVAHNIGQFLMASFVVHTFGVFSYLPVLLAAGTVAGALVGLLGGMILSRGSRIFKNF